MTNKFETPDRAYGSKYAVFAYIKGHCVDGKGAYTQKEVKAIKADMQNESLVDLVCVYDQRHEKVTYAVDWIRESKGWNTYSWKFERSVSGLRTDGTID